ncbi:MAG TPA: hypothetical protein DDW52_05685 [Planctomycetaceae bacterium]|nr:hypothetical protein [Planctomycetaceae bacterium]
MRLMRQIALQLSFLTLVVSVVGCAQWTKPPHDSAAASPLKTLRSTPDTVVVESVLVRVPTHDLERLQAAWDSIDETIVDIQQRELLEKNGLRSGLIVGDIPSVIHDHLQGVAPDQEALENTGLASEANSLTRVMRCRSGRRKELVVRTGIQRPLHVFDVIDNHIAGETFTSATTLFDLRVVPEADGSARIALTPEVHHGELRKAFVSTELGVRPEMRREQEVWDDLRIDARLREGQVLVIAASQPPRSIGGAFFITHNADRSQDHLVLLVRLTATQLDDLFAPEVVTQAKVLAEQ